MTILGNSIYVSFVRTMEAHTSVHLMWSETGIINYQKTHSGAVLGKLQQIHC